MARHKQFDRDEALDRAMAVFWRRGYEGTSVRDLVAHMGVNRGSLYDTFGDKRTLFLAAVDRYLEGVTARRIAPLEAPGAGLGAIRRYFADLVAFSAGEGRRIGCLLTNSAVEVAPADPEAAAKVAAGLARVEAAFERALRRARAAGEIPAERDPRALARFLVCTIQGLRVMGKLGADRAALDDMAATALRALA